MCGMFVWVGCRLPMAYERELRFGLREINEQIGLNEAAFALPQHISLKISFSVPDERVPMVLDALEEMLKKEKPFAVQLGGVTQLAGGVLCLNVRQNARLKTLHTRLDDMLKKDFGVPQHLFDTDFRFHSTLFMDPDDEKRSRMYDILAQFPHDETLGVESFLLGTSVSGKAGTYQVVREISL